MCCTFGDKTDVAWFKKHNLPYKEIIDHGGKFVAGTGILAGLNVKDARTTRHPRAYSTKFLRGQKPIVHTVNVHERCKKEIEFVILTQWFIRILDFKKEFLELADRIEWSPAFMKSRYIDWVTKLSLGLVYFTTAILWHSISCLALRKLRPYHSS